MKLWKLSQSVNNGYDTYDSAVVAAETAEEAVLIYPADYGDYNKREWWRDMSKWDSWAHPKDVTVVLIGEASPGIAAGVIVASFNAG